MRKVWAKRSKKKRKEMMGKVSEARWKGIEAKERSKHSRVMLLAKKKKND